MVKWAMATSARQELVAVVAKIAALWDRYKWKLHGNLWELYGNYMKLSSHQ
jgi:hypothetical protein